MIVNLLSRSFRLCNLAASVLGARAQRYMRADPHKAGNPYRAHKVLWQGVASWQNYYANLSARMGRR